MASKEKFIKGRGAQINPANKFHNWVYDQEPIDWADQSEDEPLLKTQFIPVYPKTIVNKVESPDIPLEYSLNPYQGCEHGCIYCYARVTHQFWGYSAGLDFEQKILVKKNAPELLAKKLQCKSWQAHSIMVSGNTDCYQPCERQFQITRQLLETFWRYRHPVGLITKNSLILRDLDILKKLASEKLVHVAISVTSLDESLRKFMEPRTASGLNRLKVIKKLTDEGIPVFAMLAPIIPGLNDHEIFDLTKATAEAGSLGCTFQIVRLNGEIGTIFEDWLEKTFPDKKEKVLNKIKSCHGGNLQDSRFNVRMRGEGKIAEVIASQFQLAKRKYYEGREMPTYNVALHSQYKTGQLSLF
ncbi:MAG: PA0069 family radical SAM protein [Saprospiraceae bacterium]|nr:PA0069 family radical SAM protein [Saprospiraceae bacterium]